MWYTPEVRSSPPRPSEAKPEETARLSSQAGGFVYRAVETPYRNTQEKKHPLLHLYTRSGGGSADLQRWASGRHVYGSSLLGMAWLSRCGSEVCQMCRIVTNVYQHLKVALDYVANRVSVRFTIEGRVRCVEYPQPGIRMCRPMFLRGRRSVDLQKFKAYMRVESQIVFDTSDTY